MNRPIRSENNTLWKEWWDQIRELPDIRRNRALTHRCKKCGKGSLQEVKTTYPEGNVEAFCDICLKTYCVSPKL